jgi:AraC-like DNA-binding protein
MISYSESNNIELIRHSESMLSYPLHSHASSHVFALVLAGSICLTSGNEARILRAGDTFMLPPLVGHSIQAISPYSMLTIAVREPTTSLRQYNNTLQGSRYHAIREFKKATGLPPAKFRIQGMVRHSQKLLKGRKSLAEVAQECGFYDQSHFIRHFKYFLGMTPSEFKLVVRS